MRSMARTHARFISHHLFQTFVCATIGQGMVHVRVSKMAGTHSKEKSHGFK
jgi:hypothetical protein